MNPEFGGVYIYMCNWPAWHQLADGGPQQLLDGSETNSSIWATELCGEREGGFGKSAFWPKNR